MGFSGDGGLATQARLNYPYDIAIDTMGNIYIADFMNSRIRKVSPDGIISTIAGDGTFSYSGDNGPAIDAQFNAIWSIAADNSGNIYVAETGSSRIRKIDSSGIVTTIAGNGSYGYPVNGIPATETSVVFPHGVTVNAAGELFISEGAYGIVRKISKNGIISLVAGNGKPGFSGDGGLATAAQISPGKVAIDAAGNIYIPEEQNHRIRKVNVQGIISTIAGNGEFGNEIAENIAATTTTIQPEGLSVDPSGNVLVSGNLLIRKINNEGMVTTVAGNKTPGISGNGSHVDSAQIYSLMPFTIDKEGDIYLGEGPQVRKISPSGIITVFAGTTQGYSGDGGNATLARFNYPSAIETDAQGNAFICDHLNARIRKVSKEGIVTTVAGSGENGYGGDGKAATAAALNNPYGITIDRSGNIFISDQSNYRIRKIDPAGIITTIAGNGNKGYNGDSLFARDAELQTPSAIKTDREGNLYFIDGSRVRKITPGGMLTTIAGNGLEEYRDGSRAINTTIFPNDIAIDEFNNIFIVDGRSILKVTTDGIITTFAGSGSDYGENVQALQAEIIPSDMAFDVEGNLLFTEPNNNRIRKITINVSNTWTGAYDTSWENPLNWSLHQLPDEHTNVVINAGTVVVSSNVIIRSLKLDPGVNFRINSSYRLNILH